MDEVIHCIRSLILLVSNWTDFFSIYRKHYIEYLVNLVNDNLLDPADIMSGDDLKRVLQRGFVDPPEKPNRMNDQQYRQLLLQVSKNFTFWKKGNVNSDTINSKPKCKENDSLTYRERTLKLLKIISVERFESGNAVEELRMMFHLFKLTFDMF